MYKRLNFTKRHAQIFIFFLLYISSLTSQNTDLSILSIPDSLKYKANAVIRFENMNIELKSSSKMIIQKEVAVTILNKSGNEDGYVDLPYDNHSSIKSIKVRIYNAFGMEVKKIKSSDFKDVSATGSSLYSDDRLKYYHHTPQSYPYTIKYSYEVSSSNTAFIPMWIPVKFYYASTQNSTYTLTYPEDITINFKENNLNGYAVKNNSGKNIISYSLKNARAFEHESLSPNFYKFGPHVKFAANKFTLAGVEGQAENWIEFGKWMNDKLLEGRNELPEETVSEIQNLVKNVDKPLERARLVYDYMQEKTRYISVQIGIGGWKPTLASEVNEIGYGDCKALTNYTYALLKAADVNSYYSVIYAKERRNIDRDIVSVQGNHVILMVPTKKDTTWLECTSQKSPFGHLGYFTDDRDALMISSEGGKIVRTRSYSNTENKQIISGEYTLDENGTISAKAKIESSGVQYDDHYGIEDMNTKEQDSHYKEFFDNINNIHLEKVKVTSDDLNIQFTEDIEFSASNYAVKSGDRMLVRLNAFNINSNIPKRFRNRKLPLEIRYGFLDIDEVVVTLPKNYQIEAMANEKELETKFGICTLKIERINDHQIKYKRKLLIKQGLYTVADYSEYRKFQKKINQLDNSKIVLIKNQTL